MSRATAIKAAAARLADQTNPEIWRSYEALAAAIIDAATPHLTDQPAPLEHDLFGAM